MNKRLLQLVQHSLVNRSNLTTRRIHISQTTRQNSDVSNSEYNVFNLQKELINTTTNLNNTRQEARFLRASDQNFGNDFQLTTKTPAQSRVEVVLPFSTDIKLRESYMNHYNGIRIGLLLEDLDSLAGEIAYRHSDGFHPKRPVTIVTASVDRIELLEPILPFFDLKMVGRVTHTGKSSIEIRIDLFTNKDGEWREAMVAIFAMVARDRFTNKAAEVHKILPQTEEEKELYKQGEENRNRRKVASDQSLEKIPPNEEERALLHNIYLKLKQNDLLDNTSNEFLIDNYPHRFMEKTIMTNTMLMFPQQKNIHHKIFGGFLMRTAYELAFTCATMYCKARPSFISLDDNQFHKPVEIGSILKLSSQIIYTGKNTLQVRVEAEVLNPALGTSETTNVFHFAFSAPVPAIITPKTYEEFIRHLEGKRIHEKGKLNAMMKSNH